MSTAGHPFVTLDGQGDEDDPAALDDAIVAALREAGLSDEEIAELKQPAPVGDTPTGDVALISRLTPTASLDDDPSLETLVFRYDPDRVAAGAAESIVWLAVWDPDAERLTTIAGDPNGDATPFAVNGDGPIDVDGDGNLETTVRAGTGVGSIRLIDGSASLGPRAAR